MCCLLLLLVGCQEKKILSETPIAANQEEVKDEAAVEEESNQNEAPVKEEETAEEVQEEETIEETPVEEPVAAPVEWQGDWMISAEPFLFGNLRIYEETDEDFIFDIRTATESSKELKNRLAAKDGAVATYEDTETGCLLTFTMETERIVVKESEECALPGITVDFNHSFILPDTFVIDDNFATTIKDGKLSPGGYGIGDSIETIEQNLGEPEAYTSPSGGLFRIYSDIGYGTDIYGGDGTVGALMVVRPEERTPDQIKALLGDPSDEGISDLDGFYYLYYTIDDKYTLYFDFDPDEKTLFRFFMSEL